MLIHKVPNLRMFYVCYPNHFLMKKVVFITGVTGQDVAYLSEFLLKKGNVVHGLKRRKLLFYAH